VSDQRKRGTIYCKQRAPITFKSTSEHVDDARETDSFMCSAITKRSCKRGHTRSVGARDTVRAVRGRRAWSCEAHLRTYAPSLASICFRQRVARSSLLDDPLKWRSAARYTCATFLGLFSRICTVGGYEVGIAQECLDLVPVYSKLTQITLFISGLLRDAQNASRVWTTARERLHAGSWSGGIDGDDSR